MLTRTLKLGAFALVLAAPATAETTVGLGLSVAFGSGAQPDAGVGVRVFSDDKRNDFTGSIGVDYMFGSRGVRPTVGFAYLGRNTYVGVDLGYDFWPVPLTPALGWAWRTRAHRQRPSSRPHHRPHHRRDRAARGPC